MNVLFLNPPSLTAENVVRDSIYGCWCKGKRIGGAMTPPYPQILLATVIRDSGHGVRVIDALAQDMTFDRVLDIIGDFDMVVILTSVMTFTEDVVIMRRLKERHPRVKTVIYGAIATFMPEYCLKHEEVDFAVRREAEWALRDFLAAYAQGDNAWRDTPGLVFRDNGSIRVNDYYPFIQSLDDLPLADWSLLPASRRYFNPSIKRYPYVTDLTSRGCPGQCIYCMAPGFYGKRVRARSPENVLDGFRRHIAAGKREIYIRDEMFTTSKKRVKAICEGMIAEGMDLTWLCSATVTSLDYETLALMKRAGCHTLKLGVESGSQEVLDNIKKNLKVEQTERVFAWCRELGLMTHAHMLIGSPGETPATLRQTLRFLKRIKPTTVTFGVITPFPGTPLFDRVTDKYAHLKHEYGLELSDLHTTGYYTDAFCDIPPDELGDWIKWAYRKFYLRPSYIWDWLKRIRTWDDVRKVVRAGLNVTWFSLRGE